MTKTYLIFLNILPPTFLAQSINEKVIKTTTILYKQKKGHILKN